MMLSVGSMFSGMGGLDLGVAKGLRHLGIDAQTLWVAENDPHASKVLRHRYPNILNLGDVTQVEWSQVPKVDLLHGGSPCTDISFAGKRLGLVPNTRSGLWEYQRRAIIALQPRYVIWENVYAALSTKAHCNTECERGCVGILPRTARGKIRPAPRMRALARVLTDLATAGYDASWRVVSARDVGACHNRKRIFVLAWRVPAGHAGYDAGSALCELSPQPGATSARFAESTSGDVSLLPTVKATNNENRQNHDRYGPNLGEALRLLPTPVVNDMGSHYSPSEWGAKCAEWKRKTANGNGHGNSLAIELKLLPTPVASDAKRNPSPSQQVRKSPGITSSNDFGRYAPTISRWEAALGRPAPAPIDDAGHIRPAFIEWMMGLPDGWVCDVPGVSRTQQIKMLGNGVVPQQAARALTELWRMPR